MGEVKKRNSPMTSRLLLTLPPLALATVAAFFLFSRLRFSPLPWPDSAAVLLTGMKLVSLHPHWDPELSSLGPLLPLISGLFSALGVNQIFGSSLAMRLLGIIPLLVSAWTLWHWVGTRLEGLGLRARHAYSLSAVAASGLLLDPTARWGALISRPEAWVGMCWILLLRELDCLEQIESANRRESGVLLRGAGESATTAGQDIPPRFWIIAALFSAALGFDRNAWLLFPALLVGLARIPNWWRVSVRTALLSLPWILHYGVYPAPPGAANTLGYAPGSLGTISGLVDGLFLELPGVDLASPVMMSAKILFWLLLGGLLSLLGFEFARIVAEFRRTRHMERRGSSQMLVLSASAAFLWIFYLWSIREDAWLGMLTHFLAWGWVGALMIRLATQGMQRTPLAFRFFAALTSLAALAALGSWVSVMRTAALFPTAYSSENLRQWNDCVERSIGSAQSGRPLKIWQAFLPDALAEAALRFKDIEINHAPQPSANLDVLLINQVMSENLAEKYEGPERPEDRTNLQRLQQRNAMQLGSLEQLNWKVCHYGPFWIDIGIRSGHAS